MLSVSGKNWQEISISNRLIEKLKIDQKLSEILSKIIIFRNFTKNEIYSISNNIKLINPFKKNKDFLLSNKILKKHIDKKNKILVIGDYDVDGCISTSLMINFLNKKKVPNSYYIPNRVKDGYGLSLNLVKKLVNKQKPNLVIALDCGSNSHSSIDFLNEKKIQSIIIDHHNIQQPYPPSSSLINPKKKNDYESYNYLCTSFLLYLLLDIFENEYKCSTGLKEELVNVLLATVSDVMPLRKLNRYLALNVLSNFDINKNFIFKYLFEKKRINRKINIDDFGFLMGPIINSAGRLYDANIVVELLTTSNVKKKKMILNKLLEFNEKRKILEEKYLKKINLNEFSKKDNIILVSKCEIPEGIVGIVASRLKDLFNKTCIVLTKSSNCYKGSARSVNNFNIGEYIHDAIKKNILISGGGHNLAAGLSVHKNNIRLFKDYLENIYKKNTQFFPNYYISKLSTDSINNEFFNEIDKISPFGNRNSNPYFLIENVKIIKPKVLKNKYISCYIKSKYGKLIKSISFNPINSKISFNLLNYKNSVNIILKIIENNWNNKRSLQIQIIDVIIDFNST